MRVLVLPPTKRDGDVTCDLLDKVSVACEVCSDAHQLASQIRAGAGAVLATEQLMASTGIEDVLESLRTQEPWSDLPLVLLMPDGVPSTGASRLLSSLSNVTLIQRPAPTSTVVSAVQAGLRARRRQYEMKHLIEREQAARQNGERANRIKDEFLATLSHELRTPLNAIFGWAQILKMSQADTATVTEAVNVIDRNVRAQKQLIEDLLDMSRIVSGKIRLDMQPIELADVVQAALDAVAPAIEAKGLRLQKQIASVGAVSGDFARLQQVLWNLLTNAVKFTPQGGCIDVLVKRADTHAEVIVSDSGEGIDPEFVPHLFERFSQADGSSSRCHGGLGLGLSIVKNLVELHGGTIAANSAGSGSGASFIIRLPLKSTQSIDQTIAHPATSPSSTPFSSDFAKLRGIKVLVIDDEQDSRELVKRLLVEHQAVPALAASASEARDQIERFRPHVIVSDIGMPGEDGIEFIRKLRTGGIKAPAIALTAFARAEDRIRCIQGGYQAHLQKPVEPVELLSLIVRLNET